jgi:delta-aminolevulinic acid dehydratase/porphobilinogen synthase
MNLIRNFCARIANQTERFVFGRQEGEHDEQGAHAAQRQRVVQPQFEVFAEKTDAIAALTRAQLDEEHDDGGDGGSETRRFDRKVENLTIRAK